MEVLKAGGFPSSCFLRTVPQANPAHFLSYVLQGQVELIAEQGPSSATTNGAGNAHSHTSGDPSGRAPKSSTERPTKASKQEDVNPQPVVNGVS